MKVTISIEDGAQTTSVVSEGIDVNVEEQERGVEATSPIDGGSAPAWLPEGVEATASGLSTERGGKNGVSSADGGVAKALDEFHSQLGVPKID